MKQPLALIYVLHLYWLHILDWKLGTYRIEDHKKMMRCVIVSYESPPIQKLHSHGDIISELYKPVFHSSHLSCNMSYGSAATIQVFHLSRQRYSYSTQSSMTELLLSVMDQDFKELSQETTLVLSNIRELDRVPKTK